MYKDEERKLIGYGRKVVAVREEIGMTRDQFAATLNLSETLLEEIERDRHLISPSEFRNIEMKLSNPFDPAWRDTDAANYGEETCIAYYTIIRLIDEKRYKEAADPDLIERYIMGYRALAKRIPKYVKQLVEFVKVMADDTLDHEEVIQRLSLVLGITKSMLRRLISKPYIVIGPKTEYLFTRLEFRILLKIAYRYWLLNDIDQAKLIYRALFFNIDRFCMNAGDRVLFPAAVARSLGAVYQKCDEYDKAERTYLKGIELCKKYNNTDQLYKILTNLAATYMQWKPRRKVEARATELFREAYYGAKYTGHTEDIKKIEDAAISFDILI